MEAKAAKPETGESKYNPAHDPAVQLARELKFLRVNHDALMEKYAGKWIVVRGAAVIAADESQFVAGTRARELGVEGPYLVHIPRPDAPLFIG